MEFILIRTIFFSLLSFDFLNSIKVFHLPLDFPWLVLFLVCLWVWLFWEKIYKKRFDFPMLMGGLFTFQLSADTLGNVLHLYKKIDWYDKFTHFSGGATAGTLTILILSYLSKKNQWKIGLKTLIIFSVSLALLFGVFYEFWEYFAYSVLNYKLIIIGVTDTANDLLFDFLGATISILILSHILKKKGYFSARAIDSKTK
jgi:hypothetical protein